MIHSKKEDKIPIKSTTRSRTNTTTIPAAILAVALVIGTAATAVLTLPSLVQEVQAQGPPAKAQAILAAEPSERGTVASGDHGRPCTSC
jgi:TRAP-type C4-dicarboxylate transport system permease small subunit